MFSHYSAILLGLSLLWGTHAHMEMSDPLPIRSSLDPSVPELLKDYNLKSPLTANGSNYPCHGYQNERPIAIKQTYKAGSQYSMSIAGTVNHGGGSCQLSLSYDNGATFKVIQSMIGGCPVTTTYPFTIPSFAPTGNALFAWTWFNEIGNREMYMNCAWVSIQGSSSKRRSKRQSTFTSMASLPNIVRANIDGLNTCATTEGVDPHFANLGPDVLYGPGKTASDPVTNLGANCDSSTPSGQTYENVGDTGFPSSATTTATAGAASTTAGVFAEGGSTLPNVPSGTTAVPAVSVLTNYNTGSTFSTVVSSSTSSSSSFVPIPVTVLSPTEWALVTSTLTATVPPTSSASSASQLSQSVPSISSPSAPSVSSPSSAASATPSPAATGPGLAFASESTLSAYLPCVPGSFLCLSATSYVICDQSVQGIPFTPSMQWIGAPQAVAAGMQCQPYLAPIPSSLAGQVNNGSATAATPNGFFRSDRYVEL
ncbi:hypothetical protein BT63DRAFT_413587 [Microthyrium microscopicum]|uniref:Endoglucanase n=1 Tax=Microthyrium microscopicum TaxID=703497 RepID=A0A6A6UCM4_9PEZI|nr:hypothetical protein BT63DRAFT_413587 [Microthyrium microscopicum]